MRAETPGSGGDGSSRLGGSGTGRRGASALSSRTFVAYALVMGFMFAAQLVFISSSSFVIQDELGLGAQVFGLSFGFVALGIMAGATISSRLVGQRPLHRIVLLTGDNEATARTIAAQVGIAAEDVYADLLPEDKARIVRDMVAQHERVAMVGDGVNDAPALAAARWASPWAPAGRTWRWRRPTWRWWRTISPGCRGC